MVSALFPIGAADSLPAPPLTDGAVAVDASRRGPLGGLEGFTEALSRSAANIIGTIVAAEAVLDNRPFARSAAEQARALGTVPLDAGGQTVIPRVEAAPVRGAGAELNVLLLAGLIGLGLFVVLR